ncbi:hypothetical protein PLANPX_4819 [Lacipirellula parvula]|uniref:Uncharacterized protein n=1 Tax=Lacipirellula parvula TaxID=2650471 RepID=A0A5K7XGT8_9BACT|nr:hypothetical protein PLANPX_4819 [Lacipirellula parvula]
MLHGTRTPPPQLIQTKRRSRPKVRLVRLIRLPGRYAK